MARITVEPLSAHPFYKRWRSILQRCNNAKCPSYKHYGAQGVQVDFIWSEAHPKGFENFCSWLEANLQLKIREGVLKAGERYEVARNDVRLHYTPTNCSVEPHGASTRNRRNTVLTVALVVELRRHKRLYPFESLEKLERKWGISVPNLSRALRGLTWQSADAQEPPLKSLKAEDLILEMSGA